MTTLRDYTLQLITLILLLILLIYAVSRVSEKISAVVNAPDVKRVKLSL